MFSVHLLNNDYKRNNSYWLKAKILDKAIIILLYI